MKNILLLMVFSFIIPVVSFAQSANVGIVTGIWFSEEVFFGGDAIRVYTAVHNNSGQDIEGNVEFFDNEISIGQKDFAALNGRVVEVWIDTVVTEGEHDYSVIITEAQINKPGQAPEVITPRSVNSSDVIIVENDNDGDNIGDREDLDDDNDGFSDEEELAQGTDPTDINSTPLQDNPDVDIVETDIDESSFIDDVLAIFNSENNIEMVPNTEGDIALIEKPNFVQNIEESYPIVTRATTPLNDLQNTIVPGIVNEREKVIKRIRPDSVENKSPEQGIATDIDALAEFDHGLVGWQYWLWSIYSWILLIGQWIFSCLVCMIILIFIGIHLILRFIFRLFRPRARIIS